MLKKFIMSVVCATAMLFGVDVDAQSRVVVRHGKAVIVIYQKCDTPRRLRAPRHHRYHRVHNRHKQRRYFRRWHNHHHHRFHR